MTATIGTLEPFYSWLRWLVGEALEPLTPAHGRRAATRGGRGMVGTPMQSDPSQAGRRMRVGGGYCGAVELTGRYMLNPHTDVRLYEDTEGRLHYLSNLRPAPDLAGERSGRPAGTPRPPRGVASSEDVGPGR